MRLKTWHALSVLCCAVLLAYYPALFAPLNSVDDVRLANHLLNKSWFSWQDFIIPGSSSFFRPLVNSSFIVDRLLWDMAAPLLHLENVFLHLLNVLLVFALARRMCLAITLESLAPPLWAAMIFGLHPINVEAVAWISGRADLLAGTFILLCLNAYCRYLHNHRVGWLFLAVITFFLGTLAKETALFLMPGLFFMAWTVSVPPFKGDSRCLISLVRPVVLTLPFGIAAAGYFSLRSWALSGRDLGLKHVGGVISSINVNPAIPAVAEVKPSLIFSLEPWFTKMDQAVTVAGFYAKKLFWPFPLNFGIVNVPDGYFWVGALLPVIAGLLIWRRSLAGSLALAAMSLASVALLVAFGDISWTPVAERYMYVPSAVLTLSCTLGAVSLPFSQMKRWLGASALGLTLIFFAATIQRSLVWQDNARLFTDTIEKSPGFAMAKNELAMVLLSRGEKQQAYDILRSLDLPESQVASLNRIAVIADEGDLPGARLILRERLKNPGSYEIAILLKLVGILERMMDNAPGEQERMECRDELLSYLTAVWEETQDPFYLYRMGQILMASGDRVGAGEKFLLAAKLFADDSVYKKPAEKLARSLAQ